MQLFGYFEHLRCWGLHISAVKIAAGTTSMRRCIPLSGIEYDEDFLSTLVAKQLTKQRWKDNTAAKEVTLDRTHTSVAPWWIVQAVAKKESPLELHTTPAKPNALRRSSPPADSSPSACSPRRLHPPTSPFRDVCS